MKSDITFFTSCSGFCMAMSAAGLLDLRYKQPSGYYHHNEYQIEFVKVSLAVLYEAAWHTETSKSWQYIFESEVNPSDFHHKFFAIAMHC